MVKKNMTVEVSFPGIEKKSAPVRSLANFIAENSSLYFRKAASDSDISVEEYMVYSAENGYTYICLGLNSLNVKEIEIGSTVFISGTLHLAQSEEPISVNTVSPVRYTQFVGDGPNVPAAVIMVEGEGQWDDWDGIYNLTVTQIETPSVEKDYLEDFAENHNIKLYDFTYTLEPGLDNYPGMYTITLDDNDFEGILYASGYCSYYENDSLVIEPVVSSPIFIESGQTSISERSINIESLVLSESPLVEPPTNNGSNISGNIRFDNMIVPYDFGSTDDECYDISALYGKSTAGNKVAAQSEDNEYIHGFKMVAAKPGSKGNNLVAVFSPYSGDGSIRFELYDTTNSNEEPIFNVEGFPPFGTDDYLNHMSCYIDDEYHSINEYIKFVYTSQFEYDDVTYKWGILDFKNDVLPEDVVVHFTGGSDSAEGNAATTITEITDSATGFVIDCDTYLCKTNSTLAVRKWSLTSENTSDVSEMDNFIKLPITITPKINGKVNTDKSVIPSDSLYSNITGACAIPLSGNAGKYDIQLRTPTFTLCEYDTESEEFVSDHDAYYKVGVVPSDGLEDTRDKIVKFLSGQCIELDYGIPSGSEIFPLSIGLLHAGWQDNYYNVLPQSNESGEYYENYTMWCSVLDLENYINTPLDYTNLSEWMPKSMCLTLFDNSTLELKGLAYFKLCNSDGTPFDVELQKPYYACLKQSEDEIVQPYDSYIYMYMTFTDEKLDGGFVRACNMNFNMYENPWQQ